MNNLSDSLSSIVTIIGTKLAGKRPDKTHPFGYGRVEYLTATVISVIILYAGFTSLIESVKKIINPTEPEYTNVTLIIVAVAVIIKFLLGRYFVRVGKEVKASSLVASGKDASLDALVSLTTLIAAAIFILWHVSIEAYLGAIIALLLTPCDSGDALSISAKSTVEEHTAATAHNLSFIASFLSIRRRCLRRHCIV